MNREVLSWLCSPGACIRHFFLVTFIAAFLAPQVRATNWYVSQTGSGEKNGTSASNAWQGIAKIGWKSMGAGDTLWIIGALHGAVAMDIRTSGTTNNYFTIAGYDSVNDRLNRATDDRRNGAT